MSALGYSLCGVELDAAVPTGPRCSRCSRPLVESKEILIPSELPFAGIDAWTSAEGWLLVSERFLSAFAPYVDDSILIDAVSTSGGYHLILPQREIGIDEVESGLRASQYCTACNTYGWYGIHDGPYVSVVDAVSEGLSCASIPLAGRRDFYVGPRTGAALADAKLAGVSLEPCIAKGRATPECLCLLEIDGPGQELLDTGESMVRRVAHDEVVEHEVAAGRLDSLLSDWVDVESALQECGLLFGWGEALALQSVQVLVEHLEDVPGFMEQLQACLFMGTASAEEIVDSLAAEAGDKLGPCGRAFRARRPDSRTLAACKEMMGPRSVDSQRLHAAKHISQRALPESLCDAGLLTALNDGWVWANTLGVVAEIIRASGQVYSCSVSPRFVLELGFARDAAVTGKRWDSAPRALRYSAPADAYQVVDAVETALKLIRCRETD